MFQGMMLTATYKEMECQREVSKERKNVVYNLLLSFDIYSHYSSCLRFILNRSWARDNIPVRCQERWPGNCRETKREGKKELKNSCCPFCPVNMDRDWLPRNSRQEKETNSAAPRRALSVAKERKKERKNKSRESSEYTVAR